GSSEYRCLGAGRALAGRPSGGRGWAMMRTSPRQGFISRFLWPLSALFALVFICAFAQLQVQAGKARPERSDLKRIVVEEALKESFPPALALAVAEAASNFDPAFRGPMGSVGIMAVRPHTAAFFSEEQALDLEEPRQNVRFGIVYLKALLRSHEGHIPTALASFAHGKAATSRSRVAGTAKEEVSASAFVTKVARLHRHYKREAKQWVAVLETAPLRRERLSRNDGPLDRLTELARDEQARERHSGTLGDATRGIRTIEERRRAVLPLLDDFSG
ncbi:MAG: lytic transglycosylase domain-containing protein, partial [Kiloniellales bacterium]|nr:lytic transglycosylase domain-containing protein [Kiloniellales bacterium]